VTLETDARKGHFLNGCMQGSFLGTDSRNQKGHFDGCTQRTFGQRMHARYRANPGCAQPTCRIHATHLIPTSVAFVDYSTAYPSVHREGLSSTLLKNDIRGNMLYHLRARFVEIKLQVLHPGISARQTVDILRGREGSRISPTLFEIFVADLVHELRAKFPHFAVIYLIHQPPNPYTLRTGSTTHI